MLSIAGLNIIPVTRLLLFSRLPWARPDLVTGATILVRPAPPAPEALDVSSVSELENEVFLTTPEGDEATREKLLEGKGRSFVKYHSYSKQIKALN